jgi:hypothetical protein
MYSMDRQRTIIGSRYELKTVMRNPSHCKKVDSMNVIAVWSLFQTKQEQLFSR